MQESYWAYWLILLGLFVMGIMMMTQNLTTSNTQDYYQLKEVTEASLLDAVDYGYYRTYGEIKINKEAFVANFLRRFAQNASLGATYKVDFYDLYEAPPKVSVKISNTSNSFTIANETTDFNVVNKLDVILVMDVYDSDAVPCKECDYYNNCVY